MSNRYHIQYNDRGEVEAFSIPELQEIGLSSDVLSQWNAFRTQNDKNWRRESMFSKLMNFTSDHVVKLFHESTFHKLEFFNIEKVIKRFARSLATGAFNEKSISTANRFFDKFHSRVPPSSQLILLALRTFVTTIHIAQPSVGVNQIRVPRWCLDVLFGPTLCTQLSIEGCTVDAAMLIGWCDIHIGTAIARRSIHSAFRDEFDFAHSDTLPSMLQFPEIESVSVLSLLFQMIESLKADGPKSETELVRLCVERSPQVSWTAIAVALSELRKSDIAVCRGTSIALKNAANCEEMFWRKSDPGKDISVFAVVFVPDESVFSLQPIVPIASSTKIWPTKQSTYRFFEQLIDNLVFATGLNFMSIAHALQECLGSVAKAMLMLIDNRDVHVVEQSGQCQLRNSDECSNSILKCPHCEFSICTACLKMLREQLPTDNLTDRQESSIPEDSFSFDRHVVHEFEALYCCPNPKCHKVLPPPFWQSMINSSSQSERTDKKLSMARAISRHVRYIDRLFADPCIIACRRQGCGCFVAVSSRSEVVRCAAA